MKTVQIVLLALVTPHAAPGQTVQRPPITGIAYVRIYAKDPAASRRFYTEELRLPAAPCPTEDCTRYQVGADQFIEVVRTDGQSDGQQLIAFRTTDAEALRRYLAARKVHVPAVARQRQDGSVEFAVADAERHGIAFIQLKVPADERGVISHRLIHAGVVVHDRAAMDSLYIGILGFRPYWHGGMKPERTDWVSLQVPDGTDWLEYMLNVPRNAS